MQFKELVETPKSIGDEDFGLTNHKNNSQKAFDILRYNPEVLTKSQIGRLVRLVGPHGGQYAFINQSNFIEYYVLYELNSLPILGRSATQIKLWRQQIAPRGLAHLVFDQYLLNDFDSIVSDSEQTTDGQRFWQTEIGTHRLSHTVGFMLGSNISVYDKKMQIQAWIDSKQAWGTTDRFRQRKFFISNLVIDPTLPGV